ncbi:MAG: phosphate ABC transporter permease subunit PstC [Microbacteriaceae bacterium]
MTSAAPQRPGSAPPLGAARTAGRPVVRPGDRIFSAGTLAAGAIILVVLAAVAIFLVVQSVPAFTTDADDYSDGSQNFWEYVLPLVFGTVWAAVLALIAATPLAMGIALFISHYAPRRIAQALGYVIDLLAAVPSVVFGLWGVRVLAPFVAPFYAFLNADLGWFPLFAGQVSGSGRTILTAGLVLAVMVLPIMTAVMREVFLQTPKLHEEAALALGATRWEMVRMTVLPFARSGIVTGIMLGLGRALGETLAVAMVLSPAHIISFLLLTGQNPNTIAANIALQWNEAVDKGPNILIASGLMLFVITFLVNGVARYVVARRTDFSGGN